MCSPQVKFLIVIKLLLLSVYWGTCSELNVIVDTSLGKIKGSTNNTNLGTLFYTFRGIRYTKPPIGTLRFKDPEPAESWTGIYDATVDGPFCPQTVNDSTLYMDEDCLRLNVYTKHPSLNNESNVLKPVIVSFHPGGFYAGSGNSRYAGPHYLMNQDIVLVTLNYRLGTLGFMSTGTSDCPGNAGLKDQVMALKWVQNHISRFGGDPNSVTIMGYSAGGLSVTLHMVSPMSQGLFHRVIAMSGSAAAQWEIPTHQLHLAQKQARLVNCSDESPQIIVECLKNIDAIEIGNTLRAMFHNVGNPVLLWKPVIEPDFGQERFLIRDPTEQFLSGDFARVPVIAGITQDEFAGIGFYMLNNDVLRNDWEANFTDIAPIYFLYESNENRSYITNELRSTFLDGPLNKNTSLAGFSHLYADSLIGFGTHRFVNLVSKFTDVYYYEHTYQGRYSFFYNPANHKPIGVVHHDDLIYLFLLEEIAPTFTSKDQEFENFKRITKMWASFAHKGNPNDNNDVDDIRKNIYWNKFNETNKSYLDIGNELVMRENLYLERYQVWERLFPLK